MRSRTSFFNGAIFAKTVVRFWPLWFLYALVWVVALPFPLGGNLAESLRDASGSDGVIYALQRLPLETATDFGVIVSGIAGCLAAMAVYSHLYSPRAAGAFAALPVRREGMFLSVTLAGLSPLLVINAAVFAAALAVEAAAGAVYAPGLLGWLAVVSMLDLFFFGLAGICAQLTGSIVILPFVYVIFNFVAYVVETLVRSMLEASIFGFSSGSLRLEVLSPVIALLSRRMTAVRVSDPVSGASVVTGYVYPGWTLVVVYAAAGLMLLAGAFLLYRRRKMETAGDVVAVKCLRPVFKYCMALGGALCLGSLLYSVVFSDFGYAGSPKYALSFTGFMLAGCFIGYFAAEMLIGKTVSVFRGKNRWLGFGVSCAVIVLVMLACRANLFGYETRLPAASDVKEVAVYSGDATALGEERNIDAALALHADIIAHKRWHGTSDHQNGACRLTLAYTLKDGSTLQRYYMLSYGGPGDPGDVKALQDLINTQEAIDFRKKTEVPVTAENITYAGIDYAVPDGAGGCAYQSLSLTAEEAYALYHDCLAPDIADGTLGRIWLITDDDYLDAVYACDIRMECSVRDSDGNYTYDSFYTTPTVDSARTDAWLEAHGVALRTQRDCGSTTYSYTAKNNAVAAGAATVQAGSAD